MTSKRYINYLFLLFNRFIENICRFSPRQKCDKFMTNHKKQWSIEQRLLLLAINYEFKFNFPFIKILHVMWCTNKTKSQKILVTN